MKLRSRIARYLKLKFFFHLFLSLSYFSIFAINFTSFTYAENVVTETQVEFSWEETDNGVKSNISISDNETYTYENIEIKFFNLPSENLKLAVSKIDKSDLPDETQAESDAYDIKLLNENNEEVTEGFDISVTFNQIEDTENISVISFENIENINNATAENFEIDDGNIIVEAKHLTIFLVTKIVDHTSATTDYIYSSTPPDEPLPVSINVNNSSDTGALRIRGKWQAISTDIGIDYVDFYFGDITETDDINSINFITNERIQVVGGAGGVDNTDFDAKLYANKNDGSFIDLLIDKNDLVPNFNTGGSSANYDLITIPVDSSYFTNLNFSNFVIRYSLAGKNLGPYPTQSKLESFFDYVGLDVSYVPADTTPPEIPTGVTIIQNTVDIGCNAYTTTRSIKIDWTDNTTDLDFDHYIYQNLSGSFTTNLTDSEFSGDIADLDGLYGYRVKAVDAIGNESSWTDYCHITLDRVSPVATITSPLAGTLLGTIEVKGTVTDINPHHYYTVVRNSSNATVAGPGTVNNTSSFTDSLLFNWDTTLVPDGEYTIRLEARDSAGNKGTVSTDIVTVTVDNTAPTVNLVFPTPSPSATSFQAVFNEDVNQTEAENPANYFLNNWPGAGGSGDLVGDATIVYNSSNFTSTITFTNAGWYISPEQEWGVENIHDLAGNLLQTTPYTEYSTPLVDPVTTDSGTDTNWHNTPVTITLTCIDINGSGCKTTYYTTDGTNPNLTSSTGNSFTISAEGEFTIKYFSIDNAGNTETINTATNTVKIDTTNPSGTVVINSDDTYTNNKTVILTITSTDNLSGVSNMAFSNDGISYSTLESFSVTKTWDLTDTDETKTVYIKLIDLAGNEFTTSDSIILDTTLPLSIISIPNNTGNNSTTYLDTWNGVIAGTSSDNFEVANVQLSIKRASDGFYFNGTDWVTSASEILLNTITSDLYATWNYDLNPDPAGNEIYTIISHATDNAGNFESSYTLTVIYDIEIPEVTLSISPTNPDGTNGIYISRPKITLTANDNFNIDYIEYQLNSNSGTWTKYTKAVEINEGTTKFYYRSTDKSGNISEVGLKNVSVDITTPDAVENVGASFNSELTETAVYWDNNDDDIYNVKVYKSKSSNVDQSSSNFFITVAKNITEITDDDVDSGNTYYYLLVTYDEAGNEGDSVKVTIVIPENENEEIIVTTETIPGPIIVVPNTITPTEEDGQVQGTNTENGTGNENEEEVLGENDVNIDLEDTENDSGFIDFLIKYWWLFLLTPFIFWLLWWIYKKNT